MAVMYVPMANNGAGAYVDVPDTAPTPPQRRFPVPLFSNGRIFVTWPDGRMDEIDRLTAGTQADLWWSVIRAAAIYGAG